MLIRLITLLFAGLYIGMITLGIEQPGTNGSEAGKTLLPEPMATRSAFAPSAAPPATNRSFAAEVAAPLPTFAAIDKTIPTAAVLTASAGQSETKSENDAGLLRIGTFDAPAHVLQDKGIDVVEVTGNVVNLRAGPSTRSNVVARLRQGTRAELIAVEDTGWMKIRDLDSGAQGFMSGSFLQRVTPG